MRSFIAIFTLFISFQSWAVNNGEVRQGIEMGMQAWHEQSQQWLSLEEFWSSYAQSQAQLTGSKPWPASKHYPQYEAVNNGDTFVILLKGSSCLIEFYHARWRRANDVRRWDDAFNAYGACPFVFE